MIRLENNKKEKGIFYGIVQYTTDKAKNISFETFAMT